MAHQNIWKAFLITLAGLGLLAFSSCDNAHNVHAGNLVTVEGYVFISRTQRTGAPDVRVILEKSEESSTPAEIPDVIVTTDNNGRWEARFTLSYPGGVGVTDIQPQYVEESMRILMVSNENKFFDLGTGFTFQVGETYKIWDVFLEDFGAPEKE